ANPPAGRAAPATDRSGRPATGSVQLGKSGVHRTTGAPRRPTAPADPASDPATTATTVPVRRPGPDSGSYPARSAAAPPEQGAPPPEMADRARNLLVPVAEPPAPVHEGVQPALPGKPSSVPLRSKGPGAESGVEGGDPCGWCGTPNRPDRHYCARCAMDLDAVDRDDEPAPLPWWRRLLGGDDKRLHWAGERPRVRRTYAHLVRWIAIAGIGLLIVIGLFKLPTAISATKDHFAVRTPVTHDQVGASRSYEGNPPEHAFDLVSDSWWGPGVSDSGAGEWLQVDFDRPTSVLDLVITPGESTRARDLKNSAQPRRIEVLVTTVDGKSFSREIELSQGAGPQQVPFRAHEVRSIRFIILSAYGADPDKQVAIAEIELFGPSGKYGRR
ncbi:discoidin domain-containing protein, partial [Streptomyces spiramenti]